MSIQESAPQTKEPTFLEQLKKKNKFVAEISDPDLKFDLYRMVAEGQSKGEAVKVTPLYIVFDDTTMTPKQLFYRSTSSPTVTREAVYRNGTWEDYPD